MNLFISNDKVVDSGFIPYIVTALKAYLCEHISTDSLERWDAYLKNLNDISLSGKTAYEIVVLGIKNIDAKKENKGFEIGIKNGENSSEILAKLYEVCKLINSGNLTVNGTFLFTNAFEHFNSHLSQYIVHYIGSV